MNFYNMTEEQLKQYDYGSSDIEFENMYSSDDDGYEKNNKNNKNMNNNVITKNKDQIPLERLEPISDSVLLSKFTELTKMFYSAIKNSNMSEEAKNKLRTPYQKIEKEIKDKLGLSEKKNQKQCDNSNCSCADCQLTKKRWTAKKMLLTIPYTKAPKDIVMEYYKTKYNLCKIAIAQEKHKEFNDKYNTDLHLHLFIEWTAKKDIKNPSYLNLDESFKQYGNINVDIETIRKRTKENVYSYLLKTDKGAKSWGFNIHYDSYGKLKAKELWYKYYTGEWSLKDIVAYDPSIAFGRDLKKLKNRIDSNFSWIDDDYEGKISKRINWA